MSNLENNSPQIDLAQPGVVEGLVADLRVPFCIMSPSMTATTGRADSPLAIGGCYVPPAGVARDSLLRGNPGAGYSFSHPDGTAIGDAVFHFVLPDEIGSLKARIEAALPNLGL